VKFMKSKANWSAYWKQGTASTCEQSNNGYITAVNRHWQEKLKAIKKNTQILDLCTGNGFLISCLKTCNADFGSITVKGVDYADVKLPQELTECDNVKIYDQTSVENLPFNSNSFDYLVSNYGIEYSNLSNSLIEVARVSKINAKIEFFCHCPDSALISDSKKILIALKKVRQTKIFSHIKALVKALEVKESKAEDYRIKLNNELSVLASESVIYLEDSQILAFLKYLFSPQVTNKSTCYEHYNAENIAYIARLEAMINSALTNEKLAIFEKTFSQNNINITNLTKIYHQNNVIGLHISAIKK
jgi:ubiquinone/menaquinone biosynthesis C-methylase UbiE